MAKNSSWFGEEECFCGGGLPVDVDKAALLPLPLSVSPPFTSPLDLGFWPNYTIHLCIIFYIDKDSINKKYH